jgi:hypothetical protein
MTVGSKIKKAVVVAALSAGGLATAVPAQAGSLERGLLAGFIGGMALAALAASAQAHQQAVPILATVPTDRPGPEALPEARPQLRSLRRGPGRQQTRARRVTAPRAVREARAPSAAVARCGDYLASQARPLGSEEVSVSRAGPEMRSSDGAIVLPIRARVEYARNGQRQVRQARVTCRVNSDGTVAGLQ